MLFALFPLYKCMPLQCVTLTVCPVFLECTDSVRFQQIVIPDLFICLLDWMCCDGIRCRVHSHQATSAMRLPTIHQIQEILDVLCGES